MESIPASRAATKPLPTFGFASTSTSLLRPPSHSEHVGRIVTQAQHHETGARCCRPLHAFSHIYASVVSETTASKQIS
jgi:hypothetical protein